LADRRRDLPPALVAEARKRPGGWVYEIVGGYGPDDAVPPTAIRGAWKIDDDGRVDVHVLTAPESLENATTVPPDAFRIRLWGLLEQAH
jgi:hypothetical protein